MKYVRLKLIDRSHVKQGIERIQKASGLKDVPTGWYLGRGSLYSKYIISKVISPFFFLHLMILTDTW